MPGQAFSKISSMAGPQVPARHQTLNEFLRLATTRPFDRSAAIRAIESNLEVFYQCLKFVSVNNESIVTWHKSISDQVLCDLALTLSNSVQRQDANEPQPGWQQARLTQLLVGGLGGKLRIDEQQSYRLTLLSGLLGLGELLAQDVQAADWLSERGFNAPDCDVLRFQHEGLEALQESPAQLVLPVIASRIAEAMLNGFELSEEHYELLVEQFEFSEQDVHQIFEQAYIELRVENDRLLGRDDFDQRLALANLAQQFLASRTEQSILDLANECFGVSAFAVAIVHEDKLRLQYQGELFEVSHASSSSNLARAFQIQSEFSAEGNALAAIVDKQIYSRMAANVLWYLPFERGVAVCALDQKMDQNMEQSLEQVDGYLLAAFVSACESVAGESNFDQKAMIGLDEVQARVRELTHEVNNPLAIVQNYLKTLSLRLGSDSSAQTDIKTISDEMLRIGGIIQKYAEIGQEQETEVLPVDLNNTIEEMAAVVGGANQSIDVITDLDQNLPELLIPLSEFKQVLLNLMKNGVEALEGVKAPELCVSSRGQVNLNGTHYIEIAVTDNGPGIPREVYQNLFQANNSSKGGDHSGIGLSVANRLVMEMGGHIGCRSDYHGTQFQILLPIQNKLN